MKICFLEFIWFLTKRNDLYYKEEKASKRSLIVSFILVCVCVCVFYFV